MKNMMSTVLMMIMILKPQSSVITYPLGFSSVRADLLLRKITS